MWHSSSKHWQWVIASLVLLLLASPLAHAKRLSEVSKPMLWVVEGKKPTWLFGTIHLPDKRLSKFPLAVELAFKSSDAVYTEIPMELSEIFAAQHAMQRTDGKTLAEALPDDLEQRLNERLQAESGLLSVESLGQVKTWVVSTLVAIPDSGSASQALDMRIYNRAKREGKQVGGLESAIEQIGYFDRFSEAEQLRMLEESLDAYSDQDINEVMMQWYLEGNADNLNELMQKLAAPNSDKALQDKFVSVLLTERNQVMAERIETMLKQHPNKQYFFAVGAGHLGGSDSIVSFLTRKGYKVRRIGVPAKAR